ncbi:uncharacterized protein Triagg1_7933 [Trichoderma aggressivum f. europaeum]|uniref:Uncharacterized protein n=1 Tax=Trichoderma aggressivum f. europaeum TaxID=173218 RepID=A0AAE1IAJ4_9HYPO|nr:hypothetical protein Triagg1_7933 [Trichoderma aggressivum f. europaeum]
MSHKPSNYPGIQLTPIEQNGIRQYKRIAVVLPLLLTENGSSRETQTVGEEILKAFEEAVGAWPLLCCSVGVSEDGKLILLGTPAEYDDAQSQLRDAHDPPSTESGINRLVSQLYSKSLGAAFFRSERGLDLATGMPPVMIRLSFLGGYAVVGFSFYEAVVDGEFIGRFFSRMADFTWPHMANEVQHWYRRPLEAFPSAALNPYLFPFYDWSNSPLPQTTPKDRLVCRLIEFKSSPVTELIGRLRQAIGNFAPWHKDGYYVVAMLWATIIHARFSKHRIGVDSTARLNILLPGEPNARRWEAPDWSYFGSSTVPTVAELSVPRLLYAEAYSGDGNYSNDFQGEINSTYSVRGLAEAASAIQCAIDRVDGNYVRYLMGLKNSLQPSTDRTAYSRGIDRHTTGMVFEDWSGYFSDLAIGTPYTTGQVMGVLPCADDKEEGKIVLLPQMRGSDDTENEIGWATWVCLDVEEMPVVLRELYSQGWIIGEAAASVNTTGSS